MDLKQFRSRWPAIRQAVRNDELFVIDRETPSRDDVNHLIRFAQTAMGGGSGASDKPRVPQRDGR